jgi:hypothetical protein
MITGVIKSQIDLIWNAFWSGGISNPLEVIEQITYLLFLLGRVGEIARQQFHDLTNVSWGGDDSEISCHLVSRRRYCAVTTMALQVRPPLRL